jgi:hypothetical protein
MYYYTSACIHIHSLVINLPYIIVLNTDLAIAPINILPLRRRRYYCEDLPFPLAHAGEGKGQILTFDFTS